jgi:membrane-associated protease RseP (regulator of RpoE activity)
MLAILIPLLAGVGFVVWSELARMAVARAGKVRYDRYVIKMMRLPVDNGPRWARIGTIVVGPISVWLAVALTAFALYCCHGSPGAVVVVDQVVPGAAATGKLELGDRIVAVDGKPFAGGSALLSAIVNDKAGAPVTLAIERSGTRSEVAIQPTQSDNRWRLGIALVPELDRDVGAAAGRALAYPTLQLRAVGRNFADLITGKDQPDPGGPVRIVAEFSAPPVGSAVTIAQLAMLIGMYTLLPLLMLDLVRLGMLLVRKRG